MRTRILLLALSGLLVAACTTSAPATPPDGTRSPTAPVVIEVYKSPACTCCHEWEAYLRGRGFEVRSIPTDDVGAVKARFRLPQATWSCHTAVVAGYAVEGHVPVEAILDLLAKRPPIDAVALPGMPPGSPGMPGEKAAAFDIVAVNDGRTTPFGSY